VRRSVTFIKIKVNIIVLSHFLELLFLVHFNADDIKIEGKCEIYDYIMRNSFFNIQKKESWHDFYVENRESGWFLSQPLFFVDCQPQLSSLSGAYSAALIHNKIVNWAQLGAQESEERYVAGSCRKKQPDSRFFNEKSQFCRIGARSRHTKSHLRGRCDAVRPSSTSAPRKLRFWCRISPNSGELAPSLSSWARVSQKVDEFEHILAQNSYFLVHSRPRRRARVGFWCQNPCQSDLFFYRQRDQSFFCLFDSYASTYSLNQDWRIRERRGNLRHRQKKLDDADIKKKITEMIEKNSLWHVFVTKILPSGHCSTLDVVLPHSLTLTPYIIIIHLHFS